MPTCRDRAAIALLAWMALALLVSAAVGKAHHANGDLAMSHCHGGPVRSEGRDAPAGRGTPCQWAVPLLCCQDPGASGAVSLDVSEPAALSLRALLPPLPAAAAWMGSPKAALTRALPLPRERTGILQV
jgi:hypothetical protein